MAEYTLYCFAQSGNAYKVALMLNLLGADWEPRWVDFFNGEARSDEYRAINEMGEVPVLEVGGERYSQSGAILNMLAEGSGRFGGESERFEAMRWVLWDNHKLTSNIATLRYLTFITGGGETEVTKFLRGRMGAALKVLDGHLGRSDWIVGDAPTIADISACGYLFWPDEFGVSWDDFPGIGAWLERLKTLPGWVHPYELMPGHPLPERAA